MLRICFCLALYFACACAVGNEARTNLEIRDSFREWAAKLSVSQEELLQFPGAAEIFHNPEMYADQLIDCASSAASTQMERFVCILLIQKSRSPLFFESYDAMLAAWEKGKIPTREVVFILGQRVWVMNRLALQRERSDLQTMFDRTLASERARTAEAQALVSLLTKYKSGLMRASSLYSMHWYEPDQVSSFLVMPTTADEGSMLGWVFDFAVIHLELVGILLLAFVIVVAIYVSRQFRATNAKTD
jgi:hypothetical protein